MHLPVSLFTLAAALIPAGASLLAAPPAAPAAGPAERKALDQFERKIRPLFLARCSSCHGEKVQQAGLRLDRAAALEWRGKRGGLIDPKDPQRSLLLRALRHEDVRMPPEGRLAAADIAAVEQWVRDGAAWTPETSSAGDGVERFFRQAKDHWSLQPLRRSPLPPVRDAAWIRTPIDRFILAGLEARGLAPAPEADRRTLIRRLYFDLIGLPPPPDEVKRFINDSRPDAYDRLVEQLLASPHYGERWARHWLDVARYADTKDGVLMYGHARIRPHAYTYRDYVIRALNEDTPYDQFIREQLAADRLGPALPRWRLAAMGFLTLGRMFDANVHDVIDDQIDTTTRGFLGLTVACARCHDHKYDPIPTADYYSLYGVFAGSEAPLELPLTGEPAAAEDPAWLAKDQAKRAEIAAMLDSQYALLSRTARERIPDYLHHVALETPDPLEDAVFFRSLAPEDLRSPIVSRWRNLIRQSAAPEDPVWGAWHDYLRLDPARFAELAPAVTARRRALPEGVEPGQINPLVRQALIENPPSDPASVTRKYGELLIRVWKGGAEPPAGASPAAWKQLRLLVEDPTSPCFFPRSQTFNYMSRAEKDKWSGLLTELDVLAAQSPAAPPRAMVLVDAPAAYEPRIFVRGSATQPGDRVPRRFLRLLSRPAAQSFGPGSGRLDLARAITDSANPLTGRVLVNRVWMHHFGEPLAASPDDLGFRCDPPRQKALLDFLATLFVSPSIQTWRSDPSGRWVIASGKPEPGETRWSGLGWSLKGLHRMIVRSSSYRMSSRFDAAAAAEDPENRLLWRRPRRRLELEAMRDAMLAASGRLDAALYGRPTDAAGDPENCRRTIYGLVDRQSLPQLYRAFDFASPDQTAGRRSSTIVPQQALFGLNSPFVLRQAAALAEQARAGDEKDRIRLLYQRVLQRDPEEQEIAAALEFVRTAPAIPGPPGATSPDPWARLAQVLLLTSEFVYLD